MGDFTKPLVSIIIPTFNRPNAIKDCIDSIFRQNYKKFEIIVVDDGSEKSYSLPKNRRIRYIRNRKNMGLGYTKNVGIKNSKGKVILVLDDDILVERNYIKILVDDLLKYESEKVGAVAGRLLYPNLPKLGVEKKPLIEFSNWTGDFVFRPFVDTKKPVFLEQIHAIAVFWKSVFNDVGLFEEKMYKGNHTYVEPDFFNRMREKGYKLLFEPKAVAYHLKLGEGGCRNMSKVVYKWYTIRNAWFYLKKFYGAKAFFMWPLFTIKRIFT